MAESIYSNNLMERVALGLVPGWENFRKFGMNSAVASGTEEMWPLGTTKVWPTSAAVVSVTSSSASDDGDPAGTGARTLQIDGLDSNFKEISETITMNGTTAVTTTQTFYRVNRAIVLTAGTAGNNVGNITGTISGNAQLYIEASEGQTHQTHYTVPAGKTLLVDNYSIRVGRMSGSTDLHILAQIRLNAGASDEAWRSISDIFLWNGGDHTNDSSVTAIPAKTDVRQRIISTAATQCSGIFGGYLVTNSEFNR